MSIRYFADSRFRLPYLISCLPQELRPQDSIPFLRRVSTDLQRSEAIRLLSQMDKPEIPASESPRKLDDDVSSSPPRRRLSSSVVAAPRTISDNEPVSPRDHSFVKTTFSKRTPRELSRSIFTDLFNTCSYDLPGLPSESEERCCPMRAV